MEPAAKRAKAEGVEPEAAEAEGELAVPAEVQAVLAEMVAAATRGDRARVRELLALGVPWTASDGGTTAGEAARQLGHEGVYADLVAAGVRSQLVLALLEPKPDPAEHAAFLAMPLTYVTTASGQQVLQSADGNGVMMGWEAPLMRAHAERFCTRVGPLRVLNIGFGLGLIDTELQALAGSRLDHVIVEAHPDVARKMREEGWEDKATLLFGKWQDVLTDAVAPFDCIFYDAFSEYDADMRDLHQRLPTLLKPGGEYSYFNGLAADTNSFFHEVAYQTVEAELEQRGLTVSYERIELDVGEDAWAGIRKQYWKLDAYTLPTARRR